MTGLRILSTLAVQGVLGEVLAIEPPRQADVVFEPTALLMARIRTGERGDIAVLTSAGIDALIAERVLDRRSKRDIAVSAVGIAVRAGAPHPDISTPEALRDLLLNVPSLCYSRAGASGLHFAKVIRQLGIADEVERKAAIIPSGFTAEAVADGRCVIAIQQVSELLVVPGIDVVGPLPDAMQEKLTFSAALFTTCEARDAASDFLTFITRPELAGTYARHGLQAAGRRAD